jgi:hypothetical protein
VGVELPLLDARIDGIIPLNALGIISVTQQMLEQAMGQHFPTVAALGLEAYAERLMRVDYSDGTVVFYLDWTPYLPGYTVCYLEPWTSKVGPDGQITIQVHGCTGPEAASKAERMRRNIAPE